METRYELTNLTNDQITLFAQQKSISQEIEAALHDIVEQKSRVAVFDQQTSENDDKTDRIYDDQQRIRENLKALKESAEERALTERYTQQLADQETQLGTIERETDDLRTKRD